VGEEDKRELLVYSKKNRIKEVQKRLLRTLGGATGGKWNNRGYLSGKRRSNGDSFVRKMAQDDKFDKKDRTLRKAEKKGWGKPSQGLLRKWESSRGGNFYAAAIGGGGKGKACT